MSHPSPPDRREVSVAARLVLASCIASAAAPGALAAGGGGAGEDPEGHVILRVDGEEVTKADLDASVAYRKTYVAGRSDADLARAAIEDELIPIAALKAKFKDRLPEMRKKVEEMRARVLAGEAFENVARAGSECPSSAQGGDLGFFPRTQMVPPFARHAFTLRKGEVSETFVTVFGVHFLTVTDYKKGPTAGADEARASHVLVMFDKSPQFRNQLQAIQQGAKVEVVDAAYADLVPAKPAGGKNKN